MTAEEVGANDPEWNSNEGGNVPCPSGTTELIIDPTPDGDHEDDATVGSSTVTVSFTVAGNSITEFEVEGGLAAYVFLKATNSSNVYDYTGQPGGGIAHDDGLVSPATDSISHVVFCLVEVSESTPTPSPTEEETASPTPTPSPSPTESQLGEEETPSPTPREDTQGGTPTPTPDDGTVPDTAMGGLTQLPATVLSLVMLGALAAIAYTRLARQR